MHCAVPVRAASSPPLFVAGASSHRSSPSVADLS